MYLSSSKGFQDKVYSKRITPPIIARVQKNSANKNLKIMLVVVDGVSLTTLSSTVDQINCVNDLFGCELFKLQFVSLHGEISITQSRFEIDCEVSSREVLRHGDLKNQPHLLFRACGQKID